MELVKIGQHYAVRRKFIFWHQYLDLNHFRKYRWVTWRIKSNAFFINCLCLEIEEAKEAFNYLTLDDEVIKD